MIEIRNVDFKYEKKSADSSYLLEGMNLKIEDGEFIALLGGNGSGKSTLAKLMNGLLLPVHGEVSVDGKKTSDEESLWEIREKVGMVFQNPDNQSVATIVEEDVAFGPENLGLPSGEIRRRVEEALHAVSMEKYRRHAPHLLSGGQKQRIAIAGVLAIGSKHMIFDEPTSMLDPEGREEVLSTIRKLHREDGKTIVMITHNMDEAVFADRVIILREGKIIGEGSPNTILGDRDLLEKSGLKASQTVELADELRKAGIPVPMGILTNEELVAVL